MEREEALEITGRIWCTPENQHKVMDVTLAQAVATAIQDAVHSSEVGLMSDFGSTLQKSPRLKRYLVERLSPLLVKCTGHDVEYCNTLAEECLTTLFPRKGKK